MTQRPFVLLALLLWAMAVAVGSELALRRTHPSVALDVLIWRGPLGDVVSRLPLRARSFVADLCWVRADSYAHGSRSIRPVALVPDATRAVQPMYGYSYMTNPEIVPLLKIATFFNPEFLEAQTLLGYHLAVNLGHTREGLRHLQMGIHLNASSPRIHQLYAEVGLIMRDLGKLRRATSYLRRALEYYDRVQDAGLQPDRQGRLYRRGYPAWLAEDYFALGDLENARKFWRQTREEGGVYSEENELNRFMLSRDEPSSAGPDSSTASEEGRSGPPSPLSRASEGSDAPDKRHADRESPSRPPAPPMAAVQTRDLLNLPDLPGKRRFGPLAQGVALLPVIAFLAYVARPRPSRSSEEGRAG